MSSRWPCCITICSATIDTPVKARSRFKFWSYFWGGQEKHFAYDENSLNDHIYWQMVQSGFLGVACEPNCIFQICNQPAILGFRLHDLVYGGDVAAEVTRSYEKAWQEFGRSARTATIIS